MSELLGLQSRSAHSPPTPEGTYSAQGILVSATKDNYPILEFSDGRTPNAITELTTRSEILVQECADEIIGALEQIGSMHSVEVSDGVVRLLADKGARMDIAEVVKRSGGAVSRFEEERMDLQRVFLKLIGA